MIEAAEGSAAEAPSRAAGRSALLVEQLPSSDLASCVVIPARDEAECIAATLRALASQVDLLGWPMPLVSYEVILLANNCRDDTARVARPLAGVHADLRLHVVEIELPPDEAHVGTARRLAMDEACRRLLEVGRPHGIIATTDADTVVSPTWLAATRDAMTHGVEAVGGRIMLDPAALCTMPRTVRSRFLRNVGYWALVDEVNARVDPGPADPWPRHDQFFGASLAITARAYRRVGGLPILPSGEDAALARALRRADIGIRHSPGVRVTTSARLIGRAPDGLSALLEAWSNAPEEASPQCVPGLTTVVTRAAARRLARDLWQRAQARQDVCDVEVARLAEVVDVSPAWLADALIGAGSAGGAIEQVEARATWPGQDELIDIRSAIADLRQWLEPYRRPGTCPPAFARHLRGLPSLHPTTLGSRPRPSVLPRPSAPLEEIEAVRPLTEPPQVA